MFKILDLGDHFDPITKTIFHLGKCEVCGGSVQEPNAVSIKITVAAAVDAGLILWKGEMPPEIFYDDDLDCAKCENCFV